jgi:hypothetical protein
MSDIAMDTPDSSHAGGSTSRANKPDLYRGERSKLETWLLQVDRHFHIEGDRIEDSDKVVLASTYMKGDAEKWIVPILRKYMDENVVDADNTELVENWTTFKEKIRQVFSPFQESIIAEQKIQSLRQTTSAADYTTIFQQYATQISWNDEALVRMYKQGLKPVVRAELMRSGGVLTTLDEWVNEAIRLDNALHELALEERSFHRNVRNPPTGQSPRQGNPRHGNPRNYRSNDKRARGNYQPRLPGVYNSSNGYEGMHLDNLEKGRFKSKEPGSKETRSCYNCGKPGHLSRDCRQKNKVTRQINMLSNDMDKDADDEWEVVTPLFTRLDISKGYDIIPVHDGHEEPSIVRTPTPHPGTKVPTVWDDEGSNKENWDPAMDRALTPEELAIHTPPASPKLVRQNAVLGQDQDWVTNELNNYHEQLSKQVEESANTPLRKKPKTMNYLLDYRNQNHGLLAWSFCTYDLCRIHYDAKINNDWFPTPKRTCKWQAFDCPSDVCAKHLWDKRHSGHFPGTTQQDEISQRLMINGSCMHYTWQFCMQAGCKKHKADKESNGYGESFLDQRSAIRAVTL